MPENVIKSNIFYCTICQFPEEALPNAYRVQPYVDEIIVVHNHPVIAQVKAEFDDLGATLHYVDWKENFSYKRTQYIRKSGEIAVLKGYNKNKLWMIISDTDEFSSISLLENLQKIITKAELQGSTVCTVNVHDIFIHGEGTSNPFTFIPRPLEEIGVDEIISQSVGNYYKELLVKYQDKLEYRGKVHHTLSGTGLRNTKALPEYYYDHIKTDADLHSHGCRNWFIGGGGVQEFSDKWKQMRYITDKHDLDTWEKMEKAMKIGNIHPDILQFFIEHKDDNDRHTDSELRSFYSYYKILHENELKDIIQTVKTVVTKNGIIDAVPEVKVDALSDDNQRKVFGEKILYEPRKEIHPDIVVDSFMSPRIKLDKDENKLINKDKNKFIDKITKQNMETNENLKTGKIKIVEVIENEDEIKDFVIKAYEEVLGRVNPQTNDPDGVQNYTKAIKEGRMKRERLVDIFRRSDEYRDKGLET